MSRCLRLCAFVLLLASGARATCVSERGPRLMEGRIVACRSVLAEIRQALEARRADHEAWSDLLRRRIPGTPASDRPSFDRIVEEQLAAVRGVIFELEVEAEVEVAETGEIPTHSPIRRIRFERAPIRTLFLETGSSQCEDLSQSTIELVVERPVCWTSSLRSTTAASSGSRAS